MQLLEGRLRLTLAGEPHELAPGDWVRMAPGLPHAVDAEEPAVMLLRGRPIRRGWGSARPSLPGPRGWATIDPDTGRIGTIADGDRVTAVETLEDPPALPATTPLCPESSGG